MRAQVVLFWLWLGYSGWIAWCSHGNTFALALNQSRGGVTTESPWFSTTTDNPNYSEMYEEDGSDIESMTDDSVLPATTQKTGRNFGNRIRGINSLPYGANTVSAGGSNDSSQPFLRPRPTSAVISYNPTNYNRVLKRRKNSTTTPSSLLTYINSYENINNSFNNSTNNSNNISYNLNNRTRGSADGIANTSNTNSSTLATRPTSNPSSQQNTSALHKVIVRKRPRPVTVNDSAITSSPPSTTDQSNDPETTSNEPVDTTNSPSPAFSLPGSSNSTSSPSRHRTRYRVSPVATPSLPSSSLEAQPVSHVPVSSIPTFEYNPSVSVKDGVYRFRYSEPTYSSKRVHTEDFGVSHVTYGDHDDDEGPETTTYAPRTGDTTHPFQIDIDGSEEEFTSSLPPAYRENFNQADTRENQHGRPPVNVASIKSQEPVTVTVTHTIVAASSSKPTKVPPESDQSSDGNNQANTIPVINDNVNVSRASSEEERHVENVFSSTPSLPSLDFIQVSTASTFVNQSEEHVSSASPTAEAVNTSVVISKSNVISPAEASLINSVTIGHDEAAGQENDNASGSHHNISSNDVNKMMVPPTVSSKVVTSVYYTKEENPYYTTSSYSFTESTVYSYGSPHHDDEHDDHDHDHNHGHHHDHERPMDNSQKQQELRPTTAYWDSLGYKSATFNQSRFSTEVPANSSSDQDLSYSTPEAETEFPPNFFGERTTPMPNSEPDDHSEADNEIEDHHRPHPSDYNPPVEDGTVDTKDYPRPSSIPNDETNVPTVPVFIQVLLDMPAPAFCVNIPNFKQMIARVYEPEREVIPEQVVVFNEQNCHNVTRNYHNSNFTQPLNHSGIIKYATTTASVTKTLSSATTKAAAATSPRSSRAFSSTPSYTGIRLRNRRHSQDQHPPTYDTRENEINETDISEATTLYPVFFYLNNRNGSYDQLLTESFIHLWNVSKDTNNQSMFYDKIRKVEMVSPSQGITGQAPDNENSGIIAAITIASIAAVCLFLLGVLLVVMRHRQAQSKFAKRCTPVSLDDYSLDNISVYNSFRRKQRNRASKRSYTNAAFDDPNAPSRPCNAVGLTAILAEPIKLVDEFEDLPSVNPTMEDIPNGAETKNRYANVIPMPDTRVLLTFQEDIPNSDYINANVIRGPMGTSKGYIITQGPLDETVVDFWRMVWEQQIRVIMMLTDFSEAGIPKCAEYYPRSETVDSSQLHGDFQITLEKRDITENCITSYLVIKDMERNLRRDVIHLWYHSWPDKGVPANPKCTVDFLLKSRKYTKEPTPVLVHCSPGTGRSGTLVACDIAMREFDTQHNVNIPRTVMKIRQDRAGAVQTKEQYLHIYQVVQSYAARSANQLDSI